MSIFYKLLPIPSMPYKKTHLMDAYNNFTSFYFWLLKGFHFLDFIH